MSTGFDKHAKSKGYNKKKDGIRPGREYTGEGEQSTTSSEYGNLKNEKAIKTESSARRVKIILRGRNQGRALLKKRKGKKWTKRQSTF